MPGVGGSAVGMLGDRLGESSRWKMSPMGCQRVGCRCLARSLLPRASTGPETPILAAGTKTRRGAVRNCARDNKNHIIANFG